MRGVPWCTTEYPESRGVPRSTRSPAESQIQGKAREYKHIEYIEHVEHIEHFQNRFDGISMIINGIQWILMDFDYGRTPSVGGTFRIFFGG